VSISEIMGFGRQKGWTEYVRGSKIELNFISKIKLEMIVPDEQVDKIIDSICEKAYTGDIGDGKIFISDILDAVRIRTKERGEAAIQSDFSAD
jgi:nitrogen regulatory protein P-II 1